MKKFCELLREYAKIITNFEKKKNVTVSKRRTKITSTCNRFLHFTKDVEANFAKDKNDRNFRDHCHFTVKYRGAGHLNVI